MPDVTRSDSDRSNTLRPRVSFNRDVHVKRIVPARDSPRVVGAVTADGAGHVVVTSPVRKERLKKSKKELEDEAAKVLQQADNLDCVVYGGNLPEKFYTLPHRKQQKDYATGSLDRRVQRRGSLDLIAPKKPPRTFASSPPPQSQKTSIFDVFKKADKPKKSNLRRSVSDATNLRSKEAAKLRKRSGSDSEEHSKTLSAKKKQLTPIIEVAQREDYFAPIDRNENDKENIDHDTNAPARKKNKTTTKSESVTEQLKQYIDEVDEELYKETGIRITTPEEEVKKPPEPIIIDVDKAEKISGKKSKFKSSSLGKKLKSITQKKNKANEANTAKVLQQTQTKANKKRTINSTPATKPIDIPKFTIKPPDEQNHSPISPTIQAAIQELKNPTHSSPKMIHSSQKPTEKPPLTKGRTVDHIVKRLSHDSGSPPPLRSNVLITPNVSMQHNNNQPFSYTRGISPDKYVMSSNENSPPPKSPIIYAQVVCGSNGTSKQTVHTAYNGKKHPHSDSDEGLGGEEHGFGRKYEPKVIPTKYHNGSSPYNRRSDDYFDEVDKFKEESPILPKFRNNSYNSNGFYEHKTGYTEFIERGRGDGMDSKRRESLTEPHENGFNGTTTLLNGGRTDLSARRDLLESRINRRINDNSLRTSPQSPTNVYITESSSKYYRSGSTSPVGYKEKYVAETRTDKHGEKYLVESRSKKYFGGETDDRLKVNGYTHNGFDSEPKSLDSQISDYRSSPEHATKQSSQNRNRYTSRSEQKIFKDRNMYKSTPEMHHSHHNDYLDMQYRNNNNNPDSYHDSLRREKQDTRISSNKYQSDRYLLDSNDERKDKFGDSGIENDFGRRDSSENYRSRHNAHNNVRRECCNESEDEGFASSLLIASERQHTEDNVNNRKTRKEYDSDRTNSREDEPYRLLESMNYNKKYVPRERSIDDGSHYDPRIDKDVDRSTLKRVERKPPKPEKKSGLDKVKSLFTRDSRKKKEKPEMVREETLRARYTEYKGRDPVEPKMKKKDMKDVNTSYDYGARRRLSTPSPSPPPRQQSQRNGVKSTTSSTPTSWFKSLDRLSRKKNDRRLDKEAATFTSTEDEQTTPSKRTSATKNLRFFGDTDAESGADSVRHKSKTRSGVVANGRTRSQSSRDLHNISEEESLHHVRKVNKSMTNICESDRDIKGSRTSLKPPISPSHRPTRDVSRQSREDIRGRRRKNEVSSVESSTEGDSSQQSQRSVVYLHAATVGDIPGPGYLRNGRRAASREELASNTSSRIQPQVKTLSRSFSVLAPWRPRHYREAMDIDYTQYPKKNGKYEQKPETPNNRKQTSTLKKKAQETRKNNSSSSTTLNRRSRSKESLSQNNSSHSLLRKSREELSKGSNSTLYKKKENKQPRETSRYTRDRDEKNNNKISSKSLSVESLGHKKRDNRDEKLRDNRDISRSVSMPRDPEKSAGWFKMSKKHKFSNSAQRL